MSEDSIALVPAEADHSATASPTVSRSPSAPGGRATSARTWSAISVKASGGSRPRSSSICRSTLAGSNARPYTETSVLSAGNSASVA
ncbi:MAG: hypothetical protein J0I87_17145 [Cellulomonas sp.]|nr:hypothetical protein [Cellulomonas sp.]